MRNCQESARGKKDGKGIGWAEILEQSLFQFPQSPISFLYWESMRNQELRVSNWAHCIMDRDLGVSNWVQCIMDETIYMLSPYLLSWLFKQQSTWIIFFSWSIDYFSIGCKNTRSFILAKAATRSLSYRLFTLLYW
jgi:hypothetical protein